MTISKEPFDQPKPQQFFFCRLIPPRPDFAQTQTETERAAMMAHVGYWTKHAEQGIAVVFGPVLDPQGVWGAAIVRVGDAAELERLLKDDPAIQASIGLRYESLPMLRAVVGAR
jgi:hypothetical protein